MTDTFISYRRDGGTITAAQVCNYLRLNNFEPFYDMTGIEAGRFDEQIGRELINSENFVLILSPRALDRCNAEDDWVRKEIEMAIHHNLNIVVLQDEGFAYPMTLPDGIKTISKYQAIYYNTNSLSSRLDALIGMLKRRKEDFESFYSNVTYNKQPFSGKYLTQYEDYDRGKIVVRKAPAILHKLGNKVWGKTWFGTKQTWNISGRIYDKKRLAGIYNAKGNLDDGFGTFYLEQKDNGTLEGYWGGYDNENKRITTGRYVFKKQDKNYKVRFARKSDFPTITRIANIQLGKNYITEDALCKIVKEDDSTFCLVVYNTKNQRVVGFCISKIVEYHEIRDITNGNEIEELKFEKDIGVIKTVAIEQHAINLGLASKLVQESLTIMGRQGIRCFVSPAWKYAGQVNIASILEKNGFQSILEIPNYWYESSIKDGFMCPKCGNPCHCSCVIYLKI